MKVKIIEVTCDRCGEKHQITLSEDQYRRWKSGELLQLVAPELSIADRELLISGVCDECFHSIMKEFE